MKPPVVVSFRNMDSSEWIEELVRREVEKLQKHSPKITGCRVVLDLPHRHHHKGNLLTVRIDLSVPGKEIIVNKEPAACCADAGSAIKHAFDSARRQLDEYVRERRGEVKAHEDSVTKVSKVFANSEPEFTTNSDKQEFESSDALQQIPVEYPASK